MFVVVGFTFGDFYMQNPRGTRQNSANYHQQVNQWVILCTVNVKSQTLCDVDNQFNIMLV